FAVGECSSTGLHGADRLASNSLAEGLVFGSIVALELGKKGFKRPPPLDQEKSIHEAESNLKRPSKFSTSDSHKIKHLRKTLQEEMWKNVGILRTMKGLEIAKRKLGTILLKAEKILEKGISKEPLELRNLCVVGLLVIESALRRKESRGTHALLDYPNRDDKNWKKHISLRK
ncbi:MAG: L-aspartate oxidase, partial [Nanoarchaeota archaeon]|nr:L-aspartate oxidase [Nanoarchaeota archaeon]